MRFGSRVGLFEKYAFHRTMLRPVHEQLQSRTQCLYTSDFEAMRNFRPDILLLAEHHNAFSRPLLPETLVISTTHGLGASKNYMQLSMPWFDIVCLPSPWYRQYCTERGWLPRLDFWVTGFTAMDTALQAGDAGRPPELATLPAGPVLLFAPTFSRGLSAIEVLDAQWLQDLQVQYPELNVVLKLHPHTQDHYPDQVQPYRQAAALSDRLVYIEDSGVNVYDLLQHADILLTDVSSVALNYLHYDRPIIFVNHPGRFASDQFEPNGLVWAWRDMGREIEAQQELPAAVGEALRAPEKNGERRRQYRQWRFGELNDGRAAERVAQNVMALIEPGEEDADKVRIMCNAVRGFARGEREIGNLREELKQRSTYNINVTFNSD